MSKQMHNIEELLLDYLDGNLDKNKRAFVERYLANNPDVAEELAGLNEITLVADKEIIYTNKEVLKKTKVFRLPLYTKYAVAAGGALLIGLFLWFSIDNSPLKENYTATNITPVENTSIPTKATGSNPFSVLNPNKRVHDNKIEPTVSTPKVVKVHGVAGQKRFKRHVAEPGTEEQQIASIIHEVSNPVAINANVDNLIPLATLQQAEITTNSYWQTPVIINESRMVIITQAKTFKSRFETLVPFELAKVEARVKNTLKDVNTEGMKDRIKSAFQFNKLKEALVPSSVQETITSIQ